MTTEPDIYAYNQLKGAETHLFRGEDVRDAGLEGGKTEEPVTSICGQIRSYGPFSPEVTEQHCGNCENQLENQ